MTVSINRERSELWKDDWQQSVLLYNTWFMDRAPVAYREAREKVVNDVKRLFVATEYMRNLTPAVIKREPLILSVLRQTTAPPIATDRLMGLADANKNLMKTMEKRGIVPPRMDETVLNENLTRICKVIERMLDRDLFGWLAKGTVPTQKEIEIASVVVGDRRSSVLTDPVIRNVQEERQMAVLEGWLAKRGYVRKQVPKGTEIHDMSAGTYSIHQNVPVISESGLTINMPIDMVIQPKKPYPGRMPLLIEAKSAGDETNTNKRRKEEAQKATQLRATYGDDVAFILFLSGYFSPGYLGYEAGERIDWVWEHRVEDLALAGI